MVRTAVRVVVLAVVLLLALAPLAALVGAWRWEGVTKAEVTRLRDLPAPPRDPSLPPGVTDGEIASLPPPVARYLRAVLPPGARPVAKAHLRWDGEFLARTGDDGWLPFQAEQVNRVAPAGFVWNASLQLFPGIRAFARDAFVAGEGSLRAAVFGLWPLASAGGSREAAEAALQRHLAEAVWFPTALLPRCGVRWEAIDGTSARATLSSGGVTASLVFRFGADGLVETVYAPARWRVEGGKAVATPWEGRLRGYDDRDGMKVPATGEAAWLLPEGRAPYWRGDLAEAVYEREK